MDNKLLQSMKILAKLGGEVEVLKLVHQLPCGRTVFQSVLKPFKNRETAVIGGPIQAFDSITKHFHRRDVIKHMVALCSSLKGFKPRIEYFPSGKFSKIVTEHADADTP